MKKIILLSVLFGLITNTAFASYYKTSTHNCEKAAMLDTLDVATAQYRAIITEVECANRFGDGYARIATRQLLDHKGSDVVASFIARINAAKTEAEV